MIGLFAQALNFVLSLLMWLIIGRLILDALIGQRRNLIADLLRRTTDPVLALARVAVPRAVSDRYVALLCLLLLVILRLLLLPLLRVTP